MKTSIIANILGANNNRYTVGLLLLLWTVGGIDPNLHSMQEKIGVFATFLNYISMFKWSYEVS